MDTKRQIVVIERISNKSHSVYSIEIHEFLTGYLQSVSDYGVYLVNEFTPTGEDFNVTFIPHNEIIDMIKI